MIGQRVSHYKILDVLGEGGVGVVYKALDITLDRPVALKFLNNYIEKDQLDRERFINEAKAASAFDHPNICNIHEIGETKDGQHFICMSYYDGETLADKIKKGPIQFKEAFEIIYQIIQGLKTAHEADIIHQDIKPSNIAIDKDGVIKILDFGLSKLRHEIQSDNNTLKGTVAYMSPEVIMGMPIDQRTDIWSLGILFFEILTGKLPFSGDFKEPMMYAIVNEPPLKLSRYLAELPSGIQEIIDRMLLVNPDDRYSDINELLFDLEKFQNDYRSKNERSKSKVKIYSYVGSLIIFILFLLYFSNSDIFTETVYGNRIAVLPMIEIADEEEEDWFTEGMVDILTTELTQIRGLRVTAYSSSVKYKGTDKSYKTIATELNVNYLLETSAVQSKENILLSTRLINPETNEYIWADNYEGSLGNVIMILGKVARDIADQFELKLLLKDHNRMIEEQELDPEAFALFLQGKYFLNLLTEDGEYKAIEYFEKAIKIDSSFYDTYIGLFYCYGMLLYRRSIEREIGESKSQYYLKKAVELGDYRAETYHAMGSFKFWQQWDWEGAGKAFRKAKELNPNISGVYATNYAWYLFTMGYSTEGVREAEHLLNLDPLSYSTRFTLRVAYVFNHQYDKAIDLCKHSIQLYPDLFMPYKGLANIYNKMGRHDDAKKYYLLSMKKKGVEKRWINHFDSLYNKIGIKAYPTYWLDKAINKGWSNTQHFLVAKRYIQLGDKQKALDCLENAYKKRDGALISINKAPMFDALRDEPRFRKLIAQMKFPKLRDSLE